MRSIRLSLVLYFLVLVALVLFAVGGFVYWTTQETVQAKESSNRNLLEAQFRDRYKDENAKFDEILLGQARTLATQARVQFQWNRSRNREFYELGLCLFSAGLIPSGHGANPLLALGTGVSWFSIQLSVRNATEIQFDEHDLTPYGGSQSEQFFQITSEWGSQWHSVSMGNHYFAIDQLMFVTIPLFVPLFDDTEVAGNTVRRVTFKAPLYRRGFPPRNRGGSGRGQGQPVTVPPSRLPPPPAETLVPPSILIQCAITTTGRDKVLNGFQDELKDELAQLKTESDETLATLRLRLLWLSLGTFAATIVGGFGLVWLGLLPLKHLSVAVSRVSDKDFQLQFDDRRLPGELRPIVERLTQTLAQLRRAFTREKQAAADISHELRTPLAALLTTTEVGLRKLRTPEEYRELLGDCRATGQEMSRMVERLLALARLDAGVDTLRTQEVDVGDLAGQCVSLVRPLADARGLTLTVHAKGPARIQADPDKLREVFTNLLHNAIEYNRPGGSVDLTVERHNGRLHVEVRDTGIGIAPEARQHIFERFYRADPSRHAEGLHAGLGLAIVKGYADLMRGTIAVDSQVGEGSTFRLDLPVP